jgi:Skp family chaperone for outer membrane proteins
MKSIKKLLLLGALLLASTPFVSAQTAPVVPPATAIGAPEQVREMLQKFHAGRQEILAKRLEIVRALQNLSEEERKAIIAELRSMQKGLAEEQKALARTIREEMKAIREQRRPNG